MELHDPALPAARFLVGDGAREILRLPVEASGGTIESLRVIQVQYRPGSDVVVRYSAQIAWHGAEPSRDTLVAASAIHRDYPGVVPITADTTDGPVAVGVWRWPFDPLLPGLADVVTAQAAGELLEIDPTRLRVSVVAFRPTERAVVRVDGPDAPVAYLKVVVPERTGAIVTRHDLLRAAEVPAPRVIVADDERGVIAMEALIGPTFRDLVKSPEPGATERWPAPEAFIDLADRFGRAELPAPGPNARLTDGILHARMLATVLPAVQGRSNELAERLEAGGAPAVDGVVHGDLHEAQVVIDDRRIVGVLDVDDAGPGAAVDDLANLLARLHYRDVTGGSAPLVDYRTELHRIAAERHDLARLDRHTAAALLGLATGPFRIQSNGWQTDVERLVERAGSLVP